MCDWKCVVIISFFFFEKSLAHEDHKVRCDCMCSKKSDTSFFFPYQKGFSHTLIWGPFRSGWVNFSQKFWKKTFSACNCCMRLKAKEMILELYLVGIQRLQNFL